MYKVKPCNCGSGENRFQLTDARGIFCAYVCGKCVAEVMSHYRPEIFDDSAYECDEAIDESY